MLNRPGPASVLLCAALVATACTRMSDGAAIGAGEPKAATDHSGSWGSSPAPTAATAPPDPQEDYAEPGVVPTTQARASGTSVCAPQVPPPVRTVARVADPLAPKATVGVPEGWSMSSGDGDPVGARLQGPDMEATVSINRTSLEPAEAFRNYTDDLTSGYSISTVSTLADPMCGFSGQRLIGVLSDGEETLEYEDRVIHVPAMPQDYLISVHVEAAADAPGFDEAASRLTEDFEIGLP